MDLYNFALSRDMFYISGAAAGLALGCFFSLLKHGLSAQARNRRIVLALLLLSVMIAGWAVSVIVSKAAIFKETGVIVVAGVLAALFVLTVFFPRAAAYPLILLGGLCAVGMGYVCMRFPPLIDQPLTQEPLALVSVTGNTDDADKDGDVIVIKAPIPALNIRISDTVSYMQFSAAVIDINRLYPVAGGKKRIVLTEISTDTGIIFSDNPLESSILKSFYSPSGLGSRIGINSRSLYCRVNREGIPAGKDIPVYASELKPLLENQNDHSR